MISRKFDRFALLFIAAAVSVTITATMVNPLHGVTASPRVTFGKPVTARIEYADIGRISAAKEIETATLESDADQRQAESLYARFESIGYDLDRVRNDGHPVPRIFLAKLPGDLHEMPEVSLKKTVFFQTMLPLILQENERIQADRTRLRRIRTDAGLGKKLSARDRLWVIVLAERYKVKDESLDELLRRVDVVPPSLAMAQAAEESGWGTSRFAQDGNALFGQWTKSQAAGLVPEDRPAGMDHKVKSFATLTQSVASYMRNLNTHRSYREFRKERALLRKSGEQLNGFDLAATLTAYSERGDKYVESVRTIINVNGLQALDGARLSTEETEDPAA